MKIAELNIGLSSKSLGEFTPETALVCLNNIDFRVIASRVVESVSNDGKELCLACKVELPDNWQYKLGCVADTLGQDCIAIAGFIGHAPYDTFCAELWKSPEVSAPVTTGKEIADLLVQGYSKEERKEIIHNRILSRQVNP